MLLPPAIPYIHLLPDHCDGSVMNIEMEIGQLREFGTFFNVRKEEGDGARMEDYALDNSLSANATESSNVHLLPSSYASWTVEGTRLRVPTASAPQTVRRVGR